MSSSRRWRRICFCWCGAGRAIVGQGSQSLQKKDCCMNSTIDYPTLTVTHPFLFLFFVRTRLLTKYRFTRSKKRKKP